MKEQGIDLPSMVEYVEEWKGYYKEAYKPRDEKNVETECLEGIFSYSNFLSSPINLSYLIPCNKEGVPLVEPEGYDLLKNVPLPMWEDEESDYTKCREYQEALSRCKFVGWRREKTIDDHICRLRHDETDRCINFELHSDGTLTYIGKKTNEDLQRLGVKVTESFAKEIKLI